MNWTRVDDYHLKSDDNCFTICKYSIGGQWWYEAWRGRTMIATRLPSAEAAKAVCVDSQLEAGERTYERQVAVD